MVRIFGISGKIVIAYEGSTLAATEIKVEPLQDVVITDTGIVIDAPGSTPESRKKQLIKCEYAETY